LLRKHNRKASHVNKCRFLRCKSIEKVVIVVKQQKEFD